MKKVTLITFKGCPNANKARALLREVGVAFDDVVQDDLLANHPLRAYSSPSILLGNDLIGGSKLGVGSAGCSIDLPSAQVLRKLFQERST